MITPWNAARLARLRLIPEVRRARDFRLYTAGNRRLVDLWQYGGRAVLGHTPPSVLREMKNTAERGLFAPFPGSLESRFLKALSRLLPGRSFRLFPDEATLRRFLSEAGFSRAIIDPALSPAELPPEAAQPAETPTPALWRPFLSPLESPETAPPLIPVLPLPWTNAPLALALSPTHAALDAVYEAEPLSPVILAAAARAVYDLIAALDRGRPPFPRITAAVSQSGLWRRRGAYLSLASALDGEAYTALFRRFLDAGFLLPPGLGEPLILPGILSPGEEAKLAGLISSIINPLKRQQF
jgi:hypothetical protein